MLTEYGKISDLLKDDKKAREYFEKAISINPRNMSARYLLARLHFQSGLVEDAFRIVSAGVDLNQGEVLLNRFRFEILHRLSDKSVGEITLEYGKYMSSNPRDNFIKLCYCSFLYKEMDSHCDTLFSELRYSPFLGYTEKLRIMFDVNKVVNIEDFAEVGRVVREIARGYYLQTERFPSKTLVFLSKSKIGQLKNRQRVKYRVMFNYLGAYASDPILVE